jgi:hypothetical protein
MDPNTHERVATASASSRSEAATPDTRTRCPADPHLSTGQNTEALALYVRLRQSLVGL